MVRTSIDVLSVIETLGVEGAIQRGEEITAKCPGHERMVGRKDNHASWGINAETGVHFCFAGETEVATQAGVRPIRDLVGDAHLLSSGGWVDCEVRYFGEQPLWGVTLQRNGVVKTIRATPEHRWFVLGNGPRGPYQFERVTSELRPRQRLISKTSELLVQDMDPEGIRHGIIFGDGSRRSTGGKAWITTYSPEKAELVSRFFDKRTNFPREYKDPPVDVSKEYLLGWLAGYFATDGCVDTNGVPKLSSAKREHLEVVQDACWSVGITTHPIVSQTRDAVTPDGTVYKDHTMYSTTFSRDLPQGFFLNPKHAEREKKGAYERLRWTVVSVEDLGVVEPVYCAVVPGTHDFVLADNILTGNCFSCGYKGTLETLYLDLAGEPPPADLYEQMAVDGLMKAMSTLEEKLAPSKEVEEEFNWGDLVPVSDRMLRNRYLRRSSASDYGVMYDRDRGGWFMPLYDERENLIGGQWKLFDGPLTLPPSVDKSSTLFGLHVASKHRVVTLVESPLDAVRLDSIGIPAVSTLGAYVSDNQIKLLNRYWDMIVVAMDDDAAGHRSAESVTNRLKRVGCPSVRLDYTGLVDSDGYPAKDPGDVADDVALWEAWESSVTTTGAGRKWVYN